MKTTTRAPVFPKATASALFALSVYALATGSADANDEAPIYKSIGEDGSTVFTDQPAPDATVIKPAPLNVIDAPAATPSVIPAVSGTPIIAPNNDTVEPDSEPEESEATTIDSIAITDPLHEQTFIDPQDQIWVEFTTAPAATLPTGMSVNVRLDDELVVTGTSYRMPVDPPERGTHTLQVQVLDNAGTIITESDIIDIHVRQPVVGSAN